MPTHDAGPIVNRLSALPGLESIPVTASRTHRASCCLPVRNPGDELIEALRSFSTCTDKPYLIVIDDGSDVPVSINFSDFSIEGVVINLPANLGISAALNLAFIVSITYGFEFISRMDGDDRNFEDRFSKQIDFLDENPSCLGVFAWATIINAKGEPIGSRRSPGDSHELLHAMAINNVLIHPSAMLRAEYLKRYGLYRECYRYAEDYEYFMRGVSDGNIGVVQKMLIEYRLHGSSISFRHYRQQLVSRIATQIRYIKVTKLIGLIGLTRSVILWGSSFIIPVSALGRIKIFIRNTLGNRS